MAGDADVSRRQCRGVVDAVAGHGDDAAFITQARYEFALVLGKDFGLDLVDAKTFRHGARRRPIVAGQHHDFDAIVTQRA